MNILFDTNIILDVLLYRRLYYENSMRLMLLSEKKQIFGFISASAITDIFYITSKSLGNKEKSIILLKKLLQVVGIASVTEANIYEALELNWGDFEDSTQFVVGKSIAAQFIITRNLRDFVKSTIPVASPEEFLTRILPTATSKD
jgi:predicted nucleic acid-binding protein